MLSLALIKKISVFDILHIGENIEGTALLLQIINKM
jgi:hypothetical protein